MSSKAKNALLIKQKAAELGFMFCGISKAEFLEEEAPRLENWLHQNMHGNMSYMANYFDKRLDPTKLVEGAKSVISFALNYFPKEEQVTGTYKISRYAYGHDYHHVIRGKLKELMFFIEENIGDVEGRGFVDSAPVLDRAWAKKSGLGWVGKNGNIIHPKVGSYFFLAELIVDLELEVDGPIKDYCGTCTKCIDACPTEAIESTHVVNGSKCISYLTIELKENIPASFKGTFDDWVFGCDICQEVCPWNRFSIANNVEEFTPHPDLLTKNKKEWEEITVEIFQEVFRKSPVKRTKFAGLKRNIDFVKSC